MNDLIPESSLLLLPAAALLLLLLGLLWQRNRRRPERVPLVDWQARAAIAERRAQTAETVVKKGLIPHLARYLRGKLVVGLLKQRSDLIEGQTLGTERAEELDQRLAAAHVNLQQKMAAYEGRMQELEGRAPSPAATDPNTPDNGAPPAKRRSPFNRQRPSVTPEPLEIRHILARRQRNAHPGQVEEGAPPPDVN